MPTEKTQEQNMLMKRGGKPVFAGKTALIRLVNPSDPMSATLWLADNSNKTLRQFESEEALMATFDGNNKILRSIVTLSTDELAEDGLLGDFEVLDEEFMIKDGGRVPSVPYSKYQIKQRYGEPQNIEGEHRSLQILDGLLGKLAPGVESTGTENGNMVNQTPEGIDTGSIQMNQMSPQGMNAAGGIRRVKGIKRRPSDRETFYDGMGGYSEDSVQRYGENRSQGMEDYWESAIKNTLQLISAGNKDNITAADIDNIKSNDKLMAFYVGALCYGGYDIGDIYADIIREIKKSSSVPYISSTQKSRVFYSTPEGVKLKKESEGILTYESNMKGIDPSLFKYSVFNAPDYLFEDYFGIKDWQIDNPEIRAKMDEVKTTFQDALIEKVKDNNRQDQIIADQRYTDAKADLEEMFGIQISDNVDDAWRQVEKLRLEMSSRGISNSGIQEEGIDDILTLKRREIERLRNEQKTREDREKFSFYTTSASPSQIAALSQAEREKYGFVPSQDLLNAIDPFKLKTDHPDWTDQDISNFRALFIDENGYTRSTLYQNLANTLYDPDKGLIPGKKNIQFAQVLQDQIDEIEQRLIDEGYRSKDDVYAGKLKEEIEKIIINEKPAGDTVSTPTGETGNTITNTNTDTGQTNQQTSVTYPTSNLVPYSSGSDVVKLQNWLKTQINPKTGKPYFPSSVESTGYYGDITIQAVKDYQLANNIVDSSNAGLGYWGPLTRGYAQGIVAPSTQSNISSVAVSGISSKNKLAQLQQTADNAMNAYTKATESGASPEALNSLINSYMAAQNALAQERAKQQRIITEANKYISTGAGSNQIQTYLNSLNAEDRDVAMGVLSPVYKNLSTPSSPSTIYPNLSNSVQSPPPPSNSPFGNFTYAPDTPKSPVTPQTSYPNISSPTSATPAPQPVTPAPQTTTLSTSLDLDRANRATQFFSDNKYAFNVDEVLSQWNVVGSPVYRAAEKLGYKI